MCSCVKENEQTVVAHVHDEELRRHRDLTQWLDIRVVTARLAASRPISQSDDASVQR